MSLETGQEFAPDIRSIYAGLHEVDKVSVATETAKISGDPEDRYIALGMANSFDQKNKNSILGLGVLKDFLNEAGEPTRITGSSIDVNWYSRRYTAEGDFDIKVVYAVFKALGEKYRPKVFRFLPTSEKRFLVAHLGDEDIPKTPISAVPGQSLFNIARQSLIAPPDPTEDGKFSFFGPVEKLDNMVYGIKAITGK